LNKLPNFKNENDFNGEIPPGMPRWAKITLIIIIALILLFGIMHLIGMGGKHSPMNHMGQRSLAAHTVANKL
jgi:hypothetical protein